MSDTINRVWRVELDLRSLLENKPFRLPLSKSERKRLDNTRTDIEELKRILSPPDATRSPEPDKADEKESFDNLLQNIQSASVPGDTPMPSPARQKWKTRMRILFMPRLERMPVLTRSATPRRRRVFKTTPGIGRFGVES